MSHKLLFLLNVIFISSSIQSTEQPTQKNIQPISKFPNGQPDYSKGWTTTHRTNKAQWKELEKNAEGREPHYRVKHNGTVDIIEDDNCRCILY
ncbi:MAG TPA: hypothetical protein VHX42_00875 [Candidatus Babeliales bacterium]|jgi:hypothetical protein|nr:hypothetical protein [Candidatus Babeliales bacterium]